MDTAKTRPGARQTGRWRWRFLAVGLCVAVLALGAHTHVVWVAGPHILAPAAVPIADCLVVPGARIHPDGTPFHLLQDRLAMARELFAQGRAPRILLSGRGGGGLATDEVLAMRRWLEARGVPAEALLDDPLGLRTLDTMRRCRVEYGMRSAIVVTNPFHVARSVFLARSVGLDACGVEAPYGHDYSTGTMLRNRGREVVARLWSWLDVYVFGAAG